MTTFDEIFHDVMHEVCRARIKYPSRRHLLLAFGEEAGEVTKAFLDYHYKDTIVDERYKELIQTVAVAVRLIQEGDDDFETVVRMKP